MCYSRGVNFAICVSQTIHTGVILRKCNHSPVEHIDIPIENFRNRELTQWGMSKYTDQGL